MIYSTSFKMVKLALKLTGVFLFITMNNVLGDYNNDGFTVHLNEYWKS